MVYTIAIFPQFEGLSKVNALRKKYDPYYKQIKPHITLVYYFDEKPTKEKMHEILHNFSSFKVKLDKVRASTKDKYIFLDITNGKEKIVRLKNMLYKKLGVEWHGDFLYKPHITLGNVATKSEQRRALKEIKKEVLSFSCVIDSFYLLEIADDLLTLKSKRKYNLD